MSRRTTVIDLHDEIERLEEEVEEYEKVLSGLVDQFEEEYEDFDDVPDSEKDDFEEIEDEKKETEGKIEALEDSIDEYGGASYQIRDLSTGALADIQDQVSEESFEFDAEAGEIEDGVPKSGYGMVLTLEKSIIDQPPEAPTQRQNKMEVPNPADYPHQLGLTLYDKVDAFNTVGEADMGNSSLKQRMTS